MDGHGARRLRLGNARVLLRHHWHIYPSFPPDVSRNVPTMMILSTSWTAVPIKASQGVCTALGESKRVNTTPTPSPRIDRPPECLRCDSSDSSRHVLIDHNLDGVDERCCFFDRRSDLPRGRVRLHARRIARRMLLLSNLAVMVKG